MIGPVRPPSSDLLLTLNGVHYHPPARRPSLTAVLKIPVSGMVKQGLHPPRRYDGCPPLLVQRGLGATWPEIDRAAKIWTSPAGRIKAERDHRVPLSGRALEILDDVPREEGNDHLFIGAKKGKGLSNMAMLELLRSMAGNGYTVHRFRSTFRHWCAERTNYPRELAEVALAHALKDKTEAAYQRGDLLEKRRRLMRDWSRFCCTAPVPGKVLAFHQAQTGNHSGGVQDVRLTRRRQPVPGPSPTGPPRPRPSWRYSPGKIPWRAFTFGDAGPIGRTLGLGRLGAPRVAAEAERM